VEPTVVTAAVLEKEGNILLAQRRENVHQGGRWEFPGGKVHPGERLEDALARELLEEFGIMAEIGKKIIVVNYDYKSFRIRLIAFRVYHESGKLRLLDHQRVNWVAPDKLLSYDLAPADIPIAELLAGSAGTV
jgi:8-oxo-dGTP diphosphatase